jgi:hypothetical protein
MHMLNDSNYEEAVGAIRHILFMYVDLVQGWQGFGHNSGTADQFDAIKFVDADTDGLAYYVDLDLLRAGSAIAILCQFYDIWSEEGDLTGNIFLADYQAAVDAGRLAAFPDIEAVIRTALARDPMPLEDPWFEDAVIPIYRKYVLGFFACLAVSDRSVASV